MTNAIGGKRLSVRDAALYLKKSENAVRILIRRGYITAIRARDGSITILISELEAFLDGKPLEAS